MKPNIRERMAEAQRDRKDADRRYEEAYNEWLAQVHPAWKKMMVGRCYRYDNSSDGDRFWTYARVTSVDDDAFTCRYVEADIDDDRTGIRTNTHYRRIECDTTPPDTMEQFGWERITLAHFRREFGRIVGKLTKAVA